MLSVQGAQENSEQERGGSQRVMNDHFPMQGVQVQSLVRELSSSVSWPENQSIKLKQY